MNQSHSFSIGKAVNAGWEKTKSNLGFFLLLFASFVALQIVLGIVQGIVMGIVGKHPTVLVSLVFTLVRTVANVIVALVGVNASLQVVDDKKPTLATAFAGMTEPQLLLQYFLAALVAGLLEFVGFLALVVPGIYFCLKYTFFSYALIDKHLDSSAALKRSGELTAGIKWQLLGFDIVLGLINVVGFLCLVVGLIVTIPLTMVARAHVYRQLAAK